MGSCGQAVFVSAQGSTGDVAFLSRIAQGFVRRGHDVRVLLPPYYLQQTRRVLAGIGLLPHAGPFYQSPPAFTEAELRIRIIDAQVRLVSRGDEIEFIVGDESCEGLILLARGAGIPYFQASMMPFVPTRAFVVAHPSPSYGKFGWFNQRRWDRMRNQSAYRMTIDTRALLESEAPELARKWIRIVGRQNVRPELLDRIYREEVHHLISVNEAILPRPSDWGANVHYLPYTQWDSSSLQPSPELERFLAAGPPPIFVGFGSHRNIRFSGPDGKALLAGMATAAAKLGERLVFHASDTVWDQSLGSREVPPENTFCAGDVSHAWLFPRCRMVVCHGGYGTIHTALKSHRPLIVYPWITDQFLWASRLAQLGAAAPYRTLFCDLTADAFARDLAWIRSHPRAAERASALGDILTREDDPVTHVETIRAILAGGRQLAAVH